MEISIFEDLFINRIISLKKIYIVVSIFIVSILSIIILNNNLYDYYEGYASYNDGNLSLIVSIYDLNKITTNNEILIGGATFSYKINKIDNYLEEYKIININVDNYKGIENEIIKYKVVIDKDTILNYLIKTIKGEWLLNDLTNDKLEKINGGELTFLGAVGIIVAIVFIVGVIDGFVNPQKCGEN